MKTHWKKLVLGLPLVLVWACTPSAPPVAEATVVDAPAELADDEAFVLANVPAETGDLPQPALWVGTKVKVVSAEGDQVLVRGPEGERRVAAGSLAQGIRRAVLKEAAAGWDKATFVGYRPGAEDQKVEVVGPGSGQPRTVVLDRAVLSVDVNDVNLVLLFQRAQAETDPQVRSSLLSSALTKYSSSAFAALAQGELDKLSGHTALETRPSSLIVTADNEVPLWSSPSEASGEPVGHLAAGDQAQVVEETVKTDERDGKTARWYKLADPAGWVFGADVHE